ncbi:MAG: hypothetical protein ACYC7J_20595 [Syntrophales bacterium]
MFHRQRLLIIIPTLLLVPLLVGMVPLKLVNKLAHGKTCTQCQGTQAGQRYCSAHSLISQNQFDATTVNSASPDQGLSPCQEALGAVAESVHPKSQSSSLPLRC